MHLIKFVHSYFLSFVCDFKERGGVIVTVLGQ